MLRAERVRRTRIPPPGIATAAVPRVKSARRSLTRAAALVLGLSCAVLLGELALRIHNPVTLRLRGTALVLPTNRHDVIRHPHQQKLDAEVHIVRNELGFRGPAPPADFDSHLTIVTVGGSTTECLYLNEERTWPHVLGLRLAAVLRDVWVNNAGLDGHSTFGHVQLVNQLLTSLRPKYALFLVGVNDVDRDELNVFDRSMLVAHQGWKQRLIQASDLLSTLQAIVRTRRVKDLGLGHLTELDLASAPTSSETPEQAAEFVARHRDELAPRYAERLRLLVALSRGAGIEPILVTQPVLYSGAEDVATGRALGALEVGGRSAATRAEALGILNAATRAVAAELDVHCIDLATELPADSRFYYDWMHFTNEGAARVGEIVADGLAPFLAARHPEHVREP